MLNLKYLKFGLVIILFFTVNSVFSSENEKLSELSQNSNIESKVNIIKLAEDPNQVIEKYNKIFRFNNLIPFTKKDFLNTFNLNIKCELNDKIIGMPYGLYLEIKRFQNALLNNKKSKYELNNNIFLEAESNYRKLIATEIAKSTDSIFIEVNGYDLLSTYVNGASCNVSRVFNKLEKTLQENKNRGIVLFLDDIDAFAFEHNNPTVNLCLQLDEFGKHNNLLIILGTNNYRNILHKLQIRRGAFEKVDINNTKILKSIIQFKKNIIDKALIKLSIKLPENLIYKFSFKSIYLSEQEIDDILIDYSLLIKSNNFTTENKENHFWQVFNDYMIHKKFIYNLPRKKYDKNLEVNYKTKMLVSKL